MTTKEIIEFNREQGILKEFENKFGEPKDLLEVSRAIHLTFQKVLQMQEEENHSQKEKGLEASQTKGNFLSTREEVRKPKSEPSDTKKLLASLQEKIKKFSKMRLYRSKSCQLLLKQLKKEISKIFQEANNSQQSEEEICEKKQNGN